MKENRDKKYYWNKVNVRKILPLIVKRIVEVAQPEKIILFGSYAKRAETKDSDIDLLIIKDKIESKVNETLKIRRSLKNFRIPKDIIVVQTEEFKFYSKEYGSVIRDAVLKGKVLYEKTV